jgi:hypothetical protein
VRTLISFGTAPYRPGLERLRASAAPYFDRIVLYDSLPAEFVAKHEWLLRHRRGYGFWVWKPFLILQHLREMQAGDVVMYCDSAFIFIADPSPLHALCHKAGGVLIFHQKREGHLNKRFTRRDCFRVMECDTPEYWDGPQLLGGASVWAATPLAIDVVGEWYRWCSDPRAVSDLPSEGGEYPGFADHRHDQSILSLIAIRRRLPSYPDPSQFGNGYQESERGYGQILHIDRFIGSTYPVPCILPPSP